MKVDFRFDIHDDIKIHDAGSGDPAYRTL